VTAATAAVNLPAREALQQPLSSSSQRAMSSKRIEVAFAATTGDTAAEERASEE
jgi:hypothetical protein